MPASLDRIIYIDDSGHPLSGIVVFGWIELAPHGWTSALSAWLDMRKRLWREFGIPVTQELHMTDYVRGSGRISTKLPDRHIHSGVEYWKDFGREVATEVLETLRCIEGLRCGAVYRKGDPKELATTKAEVYTDLVRQFEQELAERDALAILVMDGDGNDPTYRNAHRELPLAERRVLEDAIHLDSKDSQLVQMADHIAWTANASIDRHPKNQFAQEWYETFLAQRDPRRTPQAI